MKSIKREARKGQRSEAAATGSAASWNRLARHASGIVILSIEPGDLVRPSPVSESGPIARSKHA